MFSPASRCVNFDLLYILALAVGSDFGKPNRILESICPADEAGVVAERCGCNTSYILKSLPIKASPFLRNRMTLRKTSQRDRHTLPVVTSPVRGEDNEQNVIRFLVFGREDEFLPGCKSIQHHDRTFSPVNGLLYYRLSLGLAHGICQSIAKNDRSELHSLHKGRVGVLCAIPSGIESRDSRRHGHRLADIACTWHLAIINGVNALNQVPVNQGPNQIRVSGFGNFWHHVPKVPPDKTGGTVRHAVFTATISAFLMVVLLATTNVKDDGIIV